jgi:hypothetical protein
MFLPARNAPAHPALVVRTEHPDMDRYLFVTSTGAPLWIEDPEAATAFASMREAARMAMRLPAALRAFGMPRDAELAVRLAH